MVEVPNGGGHPWWRSLMVEVTRGGGVVTCGGGHPWWMSPVVEVPNGGGP